MASMGLKYMGWAKMKTEPVEGLPTYNPGKVIGRAVSTNLTVTNAEGELYADDMQAEYVSEFASAQLTAEVDNIELQDQAVLYGAKFDATDGLQFYPDDNAPYGGVGGYQVLLVNNVRKFRAWFFPKAKAAMPDWTGTTKGSSISFGTQPVNMRIMAPNFGPWYYVKEFTTEAAAKAYIDEKLGVASWAQIQVQAQGADGEARSVTPVGDYAVPQGSNVELVITGTPTSLYDNGAEKSASITNGKYTLTGVTADHTIAVIF